MAAPAEPAVLGEGLSLPVPDDAQGSRINVAVRCRPLSAEEREAGVHDIIRIMDRKLVILLDPGSSMSNDYLRAEKSREKRYAFDQAFGPETGTEEVFVATTKPLIGAVLQAYNATVFAYGATGAGKTFTMIGTPRVPGVMLRTVSALFEETSGNAGGGRKSASIRCSFVEVYNENLRDLLAAEPSKEDYLDLREDPGKGMCVVGVMETNAESAEEVMSLLQRGNERRTTESTAVNTTSSRSHAVLQVTVEQREPGSQEVMLGKLSMIDLAGSERASQTDNRGVRLLEGANINRSLLALGNCINALSSGSTFVPYRDSKLTRLLKDSLGGNCRTIMIANVSPNHNSYEDTLNTLKYANRAKNIRVTARQNIMKPASHISQYQHMIEDLRGEVSVLKAKLAEREIAPMASIGEEEEVHDPAKLREAQEAGEHWKEEVVKNLESRTQLQRSLLEVDRGLEQWHVEKNRARTMISRWDELGGSSPGNLIATRAGTGARLSHPRTLEEWHDHLQQIEESIRENEGTRKMIAQHLDQNKQASRELQAQLRERVLNEDLRAFLELIQKVQVLEVERLELDHLREARRVQLEERDQEIEMLRDQLRLRNQHLAVQRALFSDEQQQQLPRRVSLLGSTLVQPSPAQKRDPIRVMHAWAPPPPEREEINGWDMRPLREREPPVANDAGPQSGAPAGDTAQRLLPGIDADWRHVEVPNASQIRGLARIQPPLDGPIVPGHARRELPPPPAPKGWREPPELRGAAPPQLPRRAGPGGVYSAAVVGGIYSRQGDSGASPHALKPQSGGPSRSGAQPTTPAPRGTSWPPLRRGLSPERSRLRRGSREMHHDDPPPAPRGGGGVGYHAGAPTALAARVPVPVVVAGPADGACPSAVGMPHPRRGASGAAEERRRLRARSEHSSNRMNRIGRFAMQPK